MKNFTIDGTEYQAEEGMTWEQWVASEYNTGGFNLDGAFPNYVHSATKNYYIALDNTCVANTTTISAGAYTTKYYAYSSGGSSN